MDNNSDNRTLGEVIRQARVAARLGLRELAKRLSITPSYLSGGQFRRAIASCTHLRIGEGGVED